MMRRSSACLAVLPCFALFFLKTAFADLALTKGCSLHFASAAEGAEILASKDDFTERLSEFDRASRLKTDRAVSTEEYLQFVRANVRAWTETEQARIEAAINKIRPALQALNLALPKSVTLIKTTGAEEGGAFYTRDTAIIFPGLREMPTAELEKTLAHELFHILSRQNPAMREALYHVIGFNKCAEPELPPNLKPRKITNPDAPRNDHSIQLKLDGQEVTGVPILFSKSEKYDPARGGEFFQYLEFAFLITKTGGGVPDSAQVVPPSKVTGFFEQIGHNTNYIIHPEEILADNFALLVLNESKVASPEILHRMRAVLTAGSRRAPSTR